MMGDAAEVLEERGSPLSPDIKVLVEKQIEGFVISFQRPPLVAYQQF